MKKTKWYPHTIKPVYTGWYEHNYGNGNFILDFYDTLVDEWFLINFRAVKTSLPDKCCKLPWRGIHR